MWGNTMSGFGVNKLTASYDPVTGKPTMTTNPNNINSKDMIKAEMAPKQKPIDENQTKIDDNLKKIVAYTTLKTKLQTLNAALKPLRKPNIFSGDADVFNKKSTELTTNSSVDANNLVAVSTADSATIGQSIFTINRLATYDRITSGVSFPLTTTVPITVNGNLVIPKADGSGDETLALTTAQTIAEIAAAINMVTSTTNVSAKLVKKDAVSYGFALSKTATGEVIDVAAGSTASVLVDLGLANSGATVTTLSAELLYDGFTIHRPTNKITDLFDNMTLDLLSADAVHPITMDIVHDYLSVKTAIISMRDAYNDFVDFYKEQTAVDDDSVHLPDAVLFNDLTLKNAYRNIKSTFLEFFTDMSASIFSDSAAGAAGVFDLNTIGLAIDKDGKIEITDDVLNQKILTDFEGVQIMFGMNAEPSTTHLRMLDWPDIIPAALRNCTVTVNVTATTPAGVPTAGEFQATISGVPVTEAVTIDADGFLNGNAASQYFKDFVVSYTGVVAPPTFTGTIRIDQGVADRICANVLPSLIIAVDPSKPVSQSNKSTIDQLIDNITQMNTRLKDKNAQLKRNMEREEDRLIKRYTAVEQRVASAQNIRRGLNAQLKAFNKN